MGLSLLVSMGFRYLRPLRSRTRYRWLWLFPLLFLLLFLALHGLDRLIHDQAWLEKASTPRWVLRAQVILLPGSELLRNLRFCVGVLTLILGFLVLLVRFFNMFTTISIFGLFLGSGALVCSLTFSLGLGQDAKNNLFQFEGDLNVRPTDDQRPFLEHMQVMRQIEQLSHVQGVAPVLIGTAALVGQSSYPSLVKLRAISVENIQHASLSKEAFVTGEWSRLAPMLDAETSHDQKETVSHATSSKRGIVVGKILAEQARIYVGDDVELILPEGTDGPQRFWVVGIFFSGNVDFDKEQVFVHLPALQSVLGMAGDVSLLQVRLKNRTEAAVVQQQLQRVLGAGPDGKGYVVLTTAQKYRSFLDTLAFERVLMFFGLGLIVIVAAFSIVSNGLMQASEKKKEVAILKSMGVGSKGVLFLFTWMGFLIGGVGVTTGVLAGILACKAMERWGIPFFDAALFYVTKVALPVQPLEITIIVGSTLLVSLLATVYPAWIISRQNVVEGLR